MNARTLQQQFGLDPEITEGPEDLSRDNGDAFDTEHSNNHLASIYGEQADQFEAVVPFIRQGLKRGERCLYVADDNSQEEVLTALRAGGIAVDAALDTGALSLHTKADTYLQTGSFETETMLDFWEQTLTEARDVNGFTGVRAAAEMTWALNDETESAQLLEYEALLNRLYEDDDYTVLCQYNRNRFSTDVLADIIHTHPFLIYEGTVCENDYYHTPEEFLDTDAATSDIEPILNGLVDRTQTELALRERERELAQYQALTEAANDVIVTIDDESTIHSVNSAVTDVFGYETEELVGEPLTKLLLDEFEPRRQQVLEHNLQTGERTIDWDYVELPGQHADGSEIPLAVSFSAVELNDAHFFTGVIRDITDRKEQEHQVNRLLDLLQHTERIADVGGWEIKPETMEVFWSDQLFDILGIDDDEEPTLDGALQVYHPDDRSLVANAVEGALDDGEPIDVEARVRTPSGDVRWLHVQGVPEVEDGAVVALRGAAQDITERKQRERALEKSNERLEEFASAVSHDLRDPLATVAMYLQLLERRYEEDLDEDAKEFIDFAVDGATRMQEMIDGLLTTYAQIDMEGEPSESVDLDPVMRDVLVDLEAKIEATDADITTEPLPTVAGDRGQLRQLLMNLVDNAIKYSGDEPPRIHIEAEQNNGMQQISVSDEGIGIGPNGVDKIFEVFSRLHPDEEYPGTGIGLALCERIVQSHGGEIWVDGQPGEGATFSFTLPSPDSERQ